MAMALDSVTIRLATAAEAETIGRVAQLDCSPAPPPPHLVAERDGVIQAVRSLRTGETVADPFRPTAELVELLRCRARGMGQTPAPRPRRRRRLALGPRYRYLGAGGRA